jgi:antitoxin PrlF
MVYDMEGGVKRPPRRPQSARATRNATVLDLRAGSGVTVGVLGADRRALQPHHIAAHCAASSRRSRGVRVTSPQTRSYPRVRSQILGKEDEVAGATLTSKGQLTLPKPIRVLLRVGTGDCVDFVVHDDGTVIVRAAAGDIRELRGLLQRKRVRRLSVDQMKAFLRQRAAHRR